MSQVRDKRFKKARKLDAKLRLALVGPTNSGKTFTALRIAQDLVPNAKIAVLDSQRGQASKYADLFDFDSDEIGNHSPETYTKAIQDAEAEGYDVLIIESLSHAWMGKDGALELVDKAAKRAQSGNKFFAWRDVTPMHNQLVDTMMSCKLHVIATIRTKMEWVIEDDERGKKVPRRVGLAPIQREGLEYEFDIVADLNASNEFIVSKTICPALKGAIIKEAGPEVAKILREWLVGEKPTEQARPVDPIAVLLDDPEVKVLFDKLGAPEAKRRVTCEKWKTKAALVPALEARLKDADRDAAPKKDAKKNHEPSTAT
jgi:hypothetical protein